MKHVTGTAGTIAVEEHGHGDGIPIVLVHGMAADASFWHATVRGLAARHRVLIPELRGHGRSAPPTDHVWEVAAFADDLAAVLAELHLERVMMVGHSFGATVVLDLLARHPARVAGALLLDPAGDFSYVPPEALRGFTAGLDDERHYADTLEGAIEVALDGAQPDTERRVRAAFLAAPHAMVRGMYRSLLAYRPTAAVDLYPGPVELVTAPVNAATFALHALRPALPRTALRDVSHWVMMDDPARVARLIEVMAKRLDEQQRPANDEP